MPSLIVVLTGDGDTDARERTRVSAAGPDVEVAESTDGASTYVAFVPIGAELAPGGQAALVRALETSGSDVAVGRTTSESKGARDLFAKRRTGIDVEAQPELLTAVSPGAVVWRRSTWEAHTPPGTPTRVAAGRAALGLAAAATVDVLPEVVLARTAPAEALARSPRAADMVLAAKRLEDHVAVLRELKRRQRPAATEAWVAAVVAGDLRWCLTRLPEADDDTQGRIVTVAGTFLTEAGPEAEIREKAIHRLAMHLARRGLHEQLLHVVKADRSGEGRDPRVLRRGVRYYADYPYREDPDMQVPHEVYRLGRELALRTRVDDVRWEGDALVVEGIAHVALLEAASPRAGLLTLWLFPGGGGRPLPLRARRVRRPDVTADSRERSHCYDWSGFRATIPVGRLAARPPTTWTLKAALVQGAAARRGAVTATSPGRARRPASRDLPGGLRVVPVTSAGTFAVEIARPAAVVERVDLEGGDLVLRGRSRTALSGSTVVALGEHALPYPVTRDDGGGFVVRVPVSDVPAQSVPQLRAAETAPLHAALDLPPLRVMRDGDEVQVSATRTGLLELTAAPPRAALVGASWPEGGELALRLRALGDATLIAYAAAAEREIALPVRANDRGHVAVLDPARRPSLAGVLPLQQGQWRFGVRREGAAAVQPLAVDASAFDALPVRHAVGAKTFVLQDVDGTLELVVGPDLRDDERGAVNQARLQQVEFPAFLAQGLRDEVVFESYQSRVYADNARYIYEELARRDTGLRCRWVTLDGQSDLPDGLEPVRMFSRDYYEALARSRFVVVPTYRSMHDWLRTPDDQIVAQTWHGAPFKRIGLDNERGERASAPDYFDRLRRESARWNFLLSPNPPSTPILRRAFAYDGRVLETGYPRTDVFFRPDRDEVAARVRARLNLPEGKRLVLYAPTMRDDVRYGGNRFSLDLHLDLAKAKAELGDDHVLLVRRHAKVVDTVTGADGDFARDVSLWPDVNELLLATDIVVSDYSSLMFDFANTGRPMLFFTYDLEDYRDRLRGFYFDVERMPGPLLRTSDEVIAGIRDADALRAEHDSTYRAFVADFCPWDDGGAAARFVDAVFS